MKILAMYLPQYHEVEENNLWWGTGYTEWNAVKNAKPLFDGHNQPRIPLNNNYYNLGNLDAKTWKWQAKLAKKYNVYGFCIYHYWFKQGRKILERPMEILLKHPEIDIKYSICWANETWRRTWYGQSNEILLEQDYGEEKEWENHFEYLLQFFKDKRYIKIDNKPMVNIYRTFEIKDLKQMKACWEKLAIKNGFSGIYIVSGTGMHGIDNRFDLFDAYYDFEPGFTLVHNLSFLKRNVYKAKCFWTHLLNKILKKGYLERRINIEWIYEASVSFLKKAKKNNIIVYPGVCPMWDNTPRRGFLGFVTDKVAPSIFEKQLNKLKFYVQDAPNDFLYVNAWNEWGEGTYLEPDECNGYAYLNAIKRVVVQNE